MNAVVELEGIVRAFPGVVALRGVSLALYPGGVHALVGENGAGKSTLINILGGRLQPDAGLLRLDQRPIHLADARAARSLGILVLHQEVDLFGDLSVAENIGIEQGLPAGPGGWLNRGKLQQRARAALELMRAPLDSAALAATLTPAQRQLLLLGAVLSRPARVLVLDEPTSSLSAGESQVLFAEIRRLRAAGVAILYVSHRFEEIFALADEITVLRDGERVWHTEVAAVTREQLIEKMVGREKALPAPTKEAASGSVLLRCRGLTDREGRFRDVSLEVRAGEVLGLYGLVGAGRSEWAQAVVGLRPVTRGTIAIEDQEVIPGGPGPMAKRGVAYVPEDRLAQGLCGGLSVRLNLVLAVLERWRWRWLTRRPEAQQAQRTVRALDIRLRSIEQTMGTLSGGNQQKVVLGRWLERRPRVLLLDEPTRGIDVAAKAEVHGLIHRLAAEGLAVVLISSELSEVLSQSDRVGVFREGQLAGIFDASGVTAGEVAAAALPVGVRQERSAAATGGWWQALAQRVPRREAALLVLLLALLATLQLGSGRLLTAASLQNVATDAALLALCALGAALVLLGGAIDISLGSQMALAAGLAGWHWERGRPLALVFPLAVATGAMCGLTNAAIALLGRVHPIVVTLGTLSLYRGLLRWWLDQDLQIPLSRRGALIEPWLGLPPMAWLGVVAAMAIGVFLHGFVAGRHLYAVGSNPSAARRAGVSLAWAWLGAFTLQGALAGLAGLLYLARSGSLQPVSYEDKTLEAIAAAVVGGVALTGGRGSVIGVALGCLFLVSLPPACEYLHLPRDWQRAVIGAIMVLAVTLDALWRRRQA